MRRHRLTLPSAITVALVFSGTALPGTAAVAAPEPGQAPAHERHAASPADFDEVDCEGPAEGEGDVYTRPPVTGPPKDAEHQKGQQPKEGDHPKGRPGGDMDHAKPQPAKEPGHVQAQPAKDTDNAQGQQPKAPDNAQGQQPKEPDHSQAQPKAPEHVQAQPPKDTDHAQGQPAKDMDYGWQSQPAKETGHAQAQAQQAGESASTPHKPAGVAPEMRRGLPLKWPRNIPDRDDAVRMLDELEVKPFSSKGYDRKHFGGAACWVRHGVNRCTTREIALKFQSLVPAKLDGPCRVVGGQWRSEYDNRTMHDPLHMDVDHIVPLRHAWGSGANTWSAAKRQEFANDLTATPQLIVVSTWSNRRKGDKAPDKWLPPGGECLYSQAWIAVKDYYGLSVTEAEKNKLQLVLNKC
ncbi:DUF1524 domain-containing protein [Streptomyces sp. NPDC021096]|uniref:HNH endonuclease family protein n=1 Tax=Streptomyces sp. NPDC021096 TaxID=3154792 RepID=UPI0033D21B13